MSFWHSISVALFLFIVAASVSSAQDRPLPSASDSLALVSATWNWVDLGDGAQAGAASIEMFSSVQSISIIRFPMRGWRVEILESDGENACATSKMATSFGASMAMNGSYFTREVKPSTFVKDDGRVISSTSVDEGFRVNGILLLKGKRKTRLHIMTSLPPDNERNSRRYHEALSAGPMLLEGGQVLFNEKDASSNFYGGRHPRSLIGYTLPDVAPKGTLAYRDEKGRIQVPSGPMVYLIVIDGRFPTQADGATIPECAFICKVLGLRDALNLDGGGSSTLWDENLGVLNHPYDNRVFDHEGERRVPNSVGVFRR